MNSDDCEHFYELDSALTLAQSICATTRSSKLDWADIIGEELETLDAIKSLEMETAQVGGDGLLGEDDQTSENEISRQLNELRDSLSSELRLLAKPEKRMSALSTMNKIIREKGVLPLRLFHDEKRGFVDSSFDQVAVGDVLDVRIADVGKRIGTLVVFDKSGKPVASFKNTYGGSYEDFTLGVCRALESSDFKVKIVEIFDKDDNTGRTEAIGEAAKNGERRPF